MAAQPSHADDGLSSLNGFAEHTWKPPLMVGITAGSTRDRSRRKYPGGGHGGYCGT